MECKQQLPPCLAEEVYLLIVEKDIHLQFLETSERHQKIHAVASKPADGLGIDHVDLPPRLTVGQELWKPGRELIVLPDLMSV